ncbi:MAG TPA: hypothetical protein VL137_00715 [Polyangiaceae bacterium]|nr:hypothetical protein [Polyangiaceae bacterium]
MRVRATGLIGAALTYSALLFSCGDHDTVIGVWAPPAGGVASGGQASVGGSGGGTQPNPSMTPPDAAPAIDAAAPTEPAAFYLEAEQGQISGPLSVGSGTDASGGQFIEATEAATDDNAPGTARAVYDFTLSAAGDYVFWGRIHSPDAEHNRFWFRIDEQTWFLWRISTGDVWFWDDFHNNTDYNSALVFTLESGAHRLEIANAVTAAQLDRLYITSLADKPPGNTTTCSPPHSIEVNGACVRSCGSYGAVTCDPTVCTGKPNLAVYDCAVCCLQ